MFPSQNLTVQNL